LFELSKAIETPPVLATQLKITWDIKLILNPETINAMPIKAVLFFIMKPAFKFVKKIFN
jgi:hypothetical protein